MLMSLQLACVGFGWFGLMVSGGVVIGKEHLRLTTV